MAYVRILILVPSGDERNVRRLVKSDGIGHREIEEFTSDTERVPKSSPAVLEHDRDGVSRLRVARERDEPRVGELISELSSA